MFLFFDSHSRDKSGFPCPDGSSFAIKFQDVNDLVIFLHKLADKLNVRSGHFGIQPLICTEGNTISKQLDSSVEENNSSEIHGYNVDMLFDIKDKEPHSQRTKSKQSRYQQWYRNLNSSRKEALIKRTKRQSKEQYQNPENAKRKCQQAREVSKVAYQNPEKAKRKCQQAREVSKVAYQNPERQNENVNKHVKFQRLHTKILKRQNENVNKHVKFQRLHTKVQKKPNANVKCQKMHTKIPKRQNENVNKHVKFQRLHTKVQKKPNANVKCQKMHTKIPKRHENVNKHVKFQRLHTKVQKKPNANVKCQNDAYQNPEKAKLKCQQARRVSQIAYKNPEKAKQKRHQARTFSKVAYQNQSKRFAKIKRGCNQRTKTNSNIATVINKFKRSCQKDQVLVYKCQVCHRINFKYQVQKFQREKYHRHVLNKCLMPEANENLSNANEVSLWICKTCHVNMKSGTVPKLAITNKLFLYKQPPELSHLNMLERHLISPAIPFMKMIPLIKGAQNGINGQVVCVKADINNTAQCLPRLPSDHNLIRVKLKRKLEYKGHHLCQDINPSNIRDALKWLKDHNPNYDGIDINFDEFDSASSDQLIHAEQPTQEGSSSTIHSDDEIISNAEIQLQISDDETALDHANIVSDNNESKDTNDTIRDEQNSLAENSDINEMLDEKDDTEMLDENDDVTNTSAPLYSFLHPVDFAQYVADKHDTSILAVAPGEGNIPEKVLEMEAQCFPVEFPDGLNTNIEKREKKLSASRYFNSRLFSADNRFARNPEYIFFALYATEVEQIHSNVSIAMRIGASNTASGEKITASMLADREQVKKIIQRDEGYRFLAHIRGTPAYWEKSKRDLFAMIRQLGIPTFFITFSAADRRWMEIDNANLEMEGKPQMTQEEHENMSWEEHCDNIMSNPVAAARMFQQRIKSLINDVIMSRANPIGEVEDYYYRTEFQQRGWPHIHMVAWIKNAPKLNENSEEEVLEFVDKYITCEIPPESDTELHDIVTSVQMHSKRHTRSCRKTGKVCRFYFPRPPSERTFICTPEDPIEGNEDNPDYIEAVGKRVQDKKRAKETLEKLWELLQDDENSEMDFTDILKTLGISQTQLEADLALMTNRQTMYLKRRVKDQWVNNYNKDLIRCWNGNMDIQYVLDPYACAMYIVSYITKAEREMGDLLKNAQKEASEGNIDAVSQLRKLGSVYLQHREISVMGAIYLTCSMPLKNSTRNVVFLQTSEDGQKISLPLKQLQENAGKSDQVWMTTQIDKYVGRPRTPEYNNMCMATFFSKHYQIAGKTDCDRLDENADDDELEYEDRDEINSRHKTRRQHKNKEPITLKNCPVKMKERKGKPAVIRYPRISVKKDKERYHMNMLRLYLPHRSKHIKPPSFPTYENYHLTGFTTINGKRERVKEVIERNMSMFESKTDELDEAWEQLQDAVDLQDAWAAINPQCEQQRLDDQLNRVRFDDSDDDFAEIEIPEFQNNNNTREQDQMQPRCAIETCNPKISQEQANSMMRNLNDKQRQVFNYVSKWCDNKARDNTIKPFYIFVTGGAGTGKSHVINCIKYYAEKTFSTTTDSADDVTVLLVAHTGTAAFNISGQTICSALKINPKSPKDYTPLAEESLNTLRVMYRHLKLLVIDEISMVNAPMLSYVHGRLQQIKGTSDMSYFGNVSVLAVGDFYQLPPICPSTPLCFPHEEILKDIWNKLFQKVELTQIMRQKDDAVFAQMLNRLRVRKQNEPLQKHDEKLLESRTVNNDVTPQPDALHLFYFNKDVDAHNKSQLSSLNTEIYTIKARDIDQSSGRIIKVHDTPHRTTRKDDTCLVPELELAVGARVMLIANVDVLDGLCNGVSGTIKGILFGSSNNMPQVVYVKFDSDRIGMKARSAKSIPARYFDCVPIEPRKETFQLKRKTFSTTREQFPLKLAWAVTIHKVQGQTTETAVISMKGLKAAMAYVALSRVTSISGMYLVDYDPKKIFCNNDIETHVASMPSCDMSNASPLLNVDHRTHFIVAHQNIQRLTTHIEDLKSNNEIRRAHIICLSETWLDNNTDMDLLSIESFTLETVNSGSGRGVAMYIQNSVNYTVLPLHANDCDVLAIKTYGATNMIIVVVYKPVRTPLSSFHKDMNDITAQLEALDTKYTVFVGDFNIDLLTKDQTSTCASLKQYYQVISEPTTRCFPKGTLIDHIYIKPKPDSSEYSASVLTTYYSYHYPVSVAIKY